MSHSSLLSLQILLPPQRLSEDMEIFNSNGISFVLAEEACIVGPPPFGWPIKSYADDKHVFASMRRPSGFGSQFSETNWRVIGVDGGLSYVDRAPKLENSKCLHNSPQNSTVLVQVTSKFANVQRWWKRPSGLSRDSTLAFPTTGANA